MLWTTLVYEVEIWWWFDFCTWFAKTTWPSVPKTKTLTYQQQTVHCSNFLHTHQHICDLGQAKNVQKTLHSHHVRCLTRVRKQAGGVRRPSANRLHSLLWRRTLYVVPKMERGMQYFWFPPISCFSHTHTHTAITATISVNVSLLKVSHDSEVFSLCSPLRHLLYSCLPRRQWE